MQNAWIISIGTELTLGQSVDTNAVWLARRLAEIGHRCDRHITAPDDLEPLVDTLRQAAAQADAVVVSGGLGPTDDDLTRVALARVAGVELAPNARSLAQIRAFFERRGRAMPERNAVQALLPRGAQAIENTCGSAPGVLLRLERALVFALPGVPFEMKRMFERDVAPRLSADSHGDVLLSRRLNCIGKGESDIGELLGDLMRRGANPEVGTTAELGTIGVRINAAGETRAIAEARLEKTEAEARRRLGALVFGRDEETLADAVGALLHACGTTLATAESCTGGLIGKLLTDTPGSSAYFKGAVVAYANEAKVELLGVDPAALRQHGAVSPEVAEQMACGARRRLGADFALSATGIAGPGGGTAAKPVGLVYIGLADGAGVQARELRYGADAPREAIRLRAANTALNLLRLRLLG
jgi:nicotinamide-nucleotide amidase